MVKKFTLFLLLGICGLFTTNIYAQQDATIDPSQIKYWIGEGDNEAIFIANWAEPDTALAWGYRFYAETVTVEDVMNDIAAVDNRFSYDGSAGWLSDIYFNDGVLDLHLNGLWWMYIVSGEMAGLAYNEQTVQDGDYIKWGDESCGTLIDEEQYIYVWEKEVAPVFAYGQEAMIDPADVVYWIGEGENAAVFAVNFADPSDVCYAWGYRFATESVTVKEMMQAIAAVDHRFAFTDEPSTWGGYMLTELTLNYNDVHYVLNGFNAMYNVNGAQSLYTFDEQVVVNGDFVKWGDYTIGTEIASWTYVWETPVQAISVYDAVEEVEALNVTVYPNPATDYIMVDAVNMTSVEIYDMAGRCVMTSTESQIDVRNLETGVYFVRVNGYTTKLVVK